MGNYNNLPTPNKEVTVDEFISTHAYYSPNNIEFRQIRFGERIQNTHIYWFHDKAFAIAWPNRWTLKENKMIYTEPVRYYRIGCDHEFKELTRDECRARNIPHEGRCWHVVECPKCGQMDAYDSSD